MNCRQERWLNSYVDGELEAARALDLEEHLDGCSACREVLSEYQRLRELLQAGDLRSAAPPGLEQKIRTELRSASGLVTGPPHVQWRWLAAAASIAATLVLAALFMWRVMAPARNQIAQEVVNSHIRSLLADHLMDVASSDRHTVKPWFSGKLDFAPVVNDLSAEGFPLIGGRLEYLNNRRVAALIYRRGHHLINLFEWPGRGSTDAKPETGGTDGYNYIRWNRAGMTYWAVSDLNGDELMEFVRHEQR